MAIYRDDDRLEGFILFVFTIFIMGFMAGLYCGGNWASNELKSQAVKNKAAHWIVDDRGNPEFEWNSQAEK
jgi:hypothetical protein